jgi:hypothetical protein
MAQYLHEMLVEKSPTVFSNPRVECPRAFTCISMVVAGSCNQKLSMLAHRIDEWDSNKSSQDPYLKYMADNYELTVFSVGYRLAPEDPWPACANDCYDAAEWLIKNGKEKFGGELTFTGGEVNNTLPFLSLPKAYLF